MDSFKDQLEAENDYLSSRAIATFCKATMTGRSLKIYKRGVGLNIIIRIKRNSKNKKLGAIVVYISYHLCIYWKTWTASYDRWFK